MKKMMISCLMAATAFTGLAACGSSSKPSATTAAATATTKAGSTGGSTNAAVEKYCKDIDDVVTQLKAVKADPTKGDLTALMSKVQELTTSAAQLSTANPNDAAAISACSQKATSALAG